MANACCSIELEPRTLRQGQLIHAREVAADAVQKILEAEELSTEFIKGVRPEKGEDQVEESGHQELEDDQEHVDYHNNNKEKGTGESFESPCQCSVITTTVESPDHQIIIKEPLSAPF